ncbi:hypothetical protein ACNVED_03995 [Legionella sp. D16C41]|uniref:hypothetical protein n=1 Tax=Legionella sp. D16C41 TaxID=3402688 RepID=UPI003AF57CDE
MTMFAQRQLLNFCHNNELRLIQKSITDDHLHDIIQFLNDHPHITAVDLSQNEITDVGAQYFAIHNKTVTTVDLSWNQVGDLGAKDFALHNKVATTVHLGNNKIGDLGVKDFAVYNKTAMTVDLKWNQISDIGAKDFAIHNKTAMTVNLSGNEHISDKGIKALASNIILQKIEINHSTNAGLLALNEKDPRKRACYGREVGIPSEVPSLLRLSLFSLKGKLMSDNPDQRKVFNKNDLNGLEDLMPLLNQNKI